MTFFRDRLAVNDYLVNAFLRPVHIDHMFFVVTVIPTAVPNSQKVSIFLERPGKLGAGQRAKVDVPFRVGVGLQLHLG